MRLGGSLLTAAACLVTLPNTACNPFVTSGSDECWEGIVEGEIVEIELVEPYLESGPYRWAGIGGPRLSSCAGVDGLHIGDRS